MPPLRPLPPFAAALLAISLSISSACRHPDHPAIAGAACRSPSSRCVATVHVVRSSSSSSAGGERPVGPGGRCGWMALYALLARGWRVRARRGGVGLFCAWLVSGLTESPERALVARLAARTREVVRLYHGSLGSRAGEAWRWRGVPALRRDRVPRECAAAWRSCWVATRVTERVHARAR